MTSTSHTTLGLRHIVLALAALALAAPAPRALAASDWSISGERVAGNQHIKKQSRALSHFTGLSVGLPASVELRIGSTEGVVIETDDNLLPLIETVIENGTLKIRPTKKSLNLETPTLKIVVQAREIERVALGGSGAIDADALKGRKVQLDLGGSGSINLKGVEADALAVTIGGSGNLKTGAGAAATLSVSIGGSGKVDLGQVKSGDASISVAGSGEAIVQVRDNLSVTIAGSGDVGYYGDPRVSKTVIGSGSVKRLGEAPR